MAAGAAAMLIAPRAAEAAPDPVTLTASVVPRTLPGNVGPSDLWLYNETIAPVLRVRRNEIFTVSFRNRLAEHSATSGWVGYLRAECTDPDGPSLYLYLRSGHAYCGSPGEAPTALADPAPPYSDAAGPKTHSQ